MILSLMLISLLLQGPAARPPAPKASVSGVVVHGGSGAPMANVSVSLARLDPALGAFAEMVAGDHPPVEIALPAEFLRAMVEEMGREAQNGDLPSEDAARVKAMRSLPIDDIETLIVSPDGKMTVISRSSPPVMTDSEGRFSFKDLAPGKYKLIFGANGYARQDYGQRGSGGAATPIVLEAGQSRRDIVMRMTPIATISGRLNDRAGRPVAGVPVQVLRYVYDENGQRKTQRVASVLTDDRGMYRIYHLTPGRYYLSAGNQPGGNAAATAGMPAELAAIASPPQLTSNRVPQNYLVSYYPGVGDIKSATILDVQPGAEVKDIDLTLELQQPYRVRGHVLDPSGGQPPQNVVITIQSRDIDSLNSEGGSARISGDTRTTYNAVDGSFELRATPGSYTVFAVVNFSRPGGAAQRGYANIDVTNADVDDLVLMVGTATSVSGAVHLEQGARTPDGDFGFLRIQLKAGDRPSADSQQTSTNAKIGSFRIGNLWPGDYRVSVAGLPPGYYLKSASFGETDVLNGSLRVAGPDSRSLEMTIGASAGQVDGVAADAQGQPLPGALIVLIPDHGRNRPELFRPAVADASGHFSLTAVVPGDYKLASWEAADPFAFFDPDLIQQADEQGKPVHITESSKQTVNVVPIPAGP